MAIGKNSAIAFQNPTRPFDRTLLSLTLYQSCSCEFLEVAFAGSRSMFRPVGIAPRLKYCAWEVTSVETVGNCNAMLLNQERVSMAAVEDRSRDQDLDVRIVIDPTFLVLFLGQPSPLHRSWHFARATRRLICSSSPCSSPRSSSETRPLCFFRSIIHHTRAANADQSYLQRNKGQQTRPLNQSSLLHWWVALSLDWSYPQIVPWLAHTLVLFHEKANTNSLLRSVFDSIPERAVGPY